MVSRIVLSLQGASIPLASDPCRARELLLCQRDAEVQVELAGTESRRDSCHIRVQ
jgi:hypothetical protein